MTTECAARRGNNLLRIRINVYTHPNLTIFLYARAPPTTGVPIRAEAANEGDWRADFEAKRSSRGRHSTPPARAPAKRPFAEAHTSYPSVEDLAPTDHRCQTCKAAANRDKGVA
jgi:hypothetical protein